MGRDEDRCIRIQIGIDPHITQQPTESGVSYEHQFDTAIPQNAEIGWRTEE